MKLLIILLTIALSNSSCNSNNDSSNNINQSTQTIYHNGKIYTVNANQVWAEAMIVDGNTITFVGSNIDAEAQADTNATYIDLNGKVVLPGIHDVHTHPLEASSENFLFILNDSETDAENFAPTIQTALTDNPSVEWIIGAGHSLNTLLDATRSPIEILDAISTTRPIAIMEQTSHSFWVNSKALELAGITASTANPQGGVYMKKADGSLNGILIDSAGDGLLDLALTPTAQRLENDYQGLIQFGLPELAKHGITSISEGRTYWKRKFQDVWQRIENEGNLTVRTNLGLWAYPTDNDATQIAMLKTMYSNDANSLLKINQIKLYSDGIIHNATCAMETDYLVDYFNLATNNGLNYFTEGRIASYIAELEPTGFDFHIHAIGNRGVKESLNAIEQSGTANGRHRITHVEFVREADFARFALLNVTADCQVAGEFTQPAFWSDNDYLVGAVNTQKIVPLKNLTIANARLTLSSDWDVSTLNPFVGIQNAVTRVPENISLEDAIKAYTLNAAYSMRQETRVGSLQTGKLADFIVLNQDIFTISPTQISTTLVDMTVLNGEVIYQR